VPFLALRTGSDGLRMVPGSAEHMAQAWMEYQFRHPGKYPHFRYAPDEGWRRMYRAILENKAQGSAFEREVLQKLGHEKNTALVMPPPGSKAQGFIPDAVPGNPNPGELVWGQPYRFVEAKARAELALTGNLKAMIAYVSAHEGHLELWIRSARHAEGPTRLTGPLEDALETLAATGRASVKYYP
jgi:Holliday junction resolvase